MPNVREGGCQCGTIRYRVDAEPIAVGICHCTECQKQSGSAFGMSLIIAKDSFQVLRGTLKTFTRPSDSGRPGCCTLLRRLRRVRSGARPLRGTVRGSRVVSASWRG
jgi:hypothetical protein